MRTAAIILLFCCLSVPSLAAAQTLEGSLAEAFRTSQDGLKLLRNAGASYGGLLSLERLPSGNYAAEARFDLDNKPVRYPLKLQRDGARWEVIWQPEATYAAALIGIVKSGELPTGRAERAWVEAERMPALPIVGTKKRFVTPFGEVPAGDRAPNESQDESQGELDLSPQLVEHVHRWVRVVLEEDPAPAGVDLLLDRSASWTLANKLLFNVSVVGLYQISIVTADGGLGVVQVASPINAVTSADRSPPTVLAMFPLQNPEDGARFGFRISTNGELVQGSGCGDGMSVCIDEPSRLPEALERLIPPGGEQAMFAASGDVSIGEAVEYLAAFEDYMGLGHHSVLMGYVQK